jgi:L-aspartate oxidase
VLHAGGDATGASIDQALARAVRAAGVAVIEHALCTGLLQTGERVCGVNLLQANGVTVQMKSPGVLLATGGAGRLFARTTNPAVATGDGIALAYRVGAELMDLEFVQFHPTALDFEGAPSFLISEAVRGEGGVLRDASGRAFMADYHPDRELAPRDVVARAIHQQAARAGSKIWLDVTHLDRALIERRFPSIVRFCRQWGIDPVTQPIPVSPAAHYLMGGIRTDANGRTTVPGLYACGEAACTGVHGANRLASNSLLEGLIFARRAVRSMLAGATGEADLSRSGEGGRLCLDESAPVPGVRAALAEAMWNDAGLVRSAASLQRARATILDLPRLTQSPRSQEEHEAANLALLAQLVLASAAVREESRGGHYRSDFPDHDRAWLGHLVIARDTIAFVPLAGVAGGRPTGLLAVPA